MMEGGSGSSPVGRIQRLAQQIKPVTCRAAAPSSVGSNDAANNRERVSGSKWMSTTEGGGAMEYPVVDPYGPLCPQDDFTAMRAKERVKMEAYLDKVRSGEAKPGSDALKYTLLGEE